MLNGCGGCDCCCSLNDSLDFRLVRLIAFLVKFKLIDAKVEAEVFARFERRNPTFSSDEIESGDEARNAAADNAAFLRGRPLNCGAAGAKKENVEKFHKNQSFNVLPHELQLSLCFSKRRCSKVSRQKCTRISPAGCTAKFKPSIANRNCPGEKPSSGF